MPLQQVLRAAEWIAQRAIGIVQQCRVCKTPLLLALSGTRKAIWMQLAAQPMKLLLQRGQVQVQARLQREHRVVGAPNGRLNLAAMGTEQSGFVMGDRTGPA